MQPIKGRMPVLVALLILTLAVMLMLGRCRHSREGHACDGGDRNDDGEAYVTAISDTVR